MAKNEKVEKILDEIGEMKSSDRLLALQTDDAGQEPEPEQEEVKEEVKAPAKGAKKADKKPNKKAAAKPTKAASAESKRKFIDEEFNLNLKPKIIIKWAVVLLLFVSVFYLGRLTAPTDLLMEESSEIVAEPTSFFSSLSGFVTSVLPDFDEETEATAVEPPAEETTEEAETPAVLTDVVHHETPHVSRPPCKGRSKIVARGGAKA